MTAPSKTTRWLDLLAFLLNRTFPVTREEIFTNVSGYLAEGHAEPRSGGKSRGEIDPESARRKFERDKDELRELGVEIETITLPQGEPDDPNAGYRLRARDFYLPYFELTSSKTPQKPYSGLTSVRLSDTEAGILDRATARLAERGHSPLASSARSLRRKLAFDLPIGTAPAERVLARTLGEPAGTILALLQQAVAEHRAVRCTYYSIGRDAEEDRVVEPWGLFFTWGQWYCVGKARDRDALRVFRLERMQKANLLAETFTVAAEFSIQDYLGRRPWELGEQPGTQATVRFAFPEARWVLAQAVGETVEETLDDGGAILAFAVRESNPFLRWLLTFGGRATILEPAALGEELVAMRKQVAAIYGGDA